MSVYINGMEMPYNCGHCFLRRGECKERIYMPNRPSNCPLIPVPDHGRLGDLDELEKRIRDYWYKHDADDFQEEFLDKMPTVIPSDK